MAAQRNINMDDVREALAGDGDTPVDPFATNARKIRDIIGRGSMATIQKHLMSIRTEATGALVREERAGTPKPPQDAVAALWGAACTAVETVFLKQCARLNDDRDQLRDALRVSVEDCDTLAKEVGRLEREAEEKTAQMAVDASAAEEVADGLQKEVAALTGRVEEAHAQNQRLETLVRKALGEAK